MVWKHLAVVASATAAAVTFAPNAQAVTLNEKKKGNSSVLTKGSPALPWNNEERMRESMEKADEHCERVQRRLGLPGLALAVSVNGRTVYERGFGYSDVENNLPMRPDSVMRIASISKPITMAMLAKQMEEGKVDIDKPLQHYLPNYPVKKWEGKEVAITVRYLLSHISGIRHYRTKEEIEKKKKESELTDSDYVEFFSKMHCDNVEQALEIFKNDELIHKPGSKYFYTTHGWTVVSAIVEKVAETSFEQHAKRMFQFWGLQNTYLDEHDPIIMNRARYYRRDKKESHLINAPWVDNSCKWAGGGFLSTVQDLVKFANIMLFSAQQPENSTAKAFLKKETMKKLWAPEKATARPFIDSYWGLGWGVAEPFEHCVGCNFQEEKFVSHGGGAVGASSTLMIQMPSSEGSTDCKREGKSAQGIVVAMITNLQDVGLSATAKKICKEFEWMMES